jgi:hypothetical protein
MIGHCLIISRVQVLPPLGTKIVEKMPMKNLSFDEAGLAPKFLDQKVL